MSVIRELSFSLREVEAYICAFEEKYKISSQDFLCNANPDIEVSEDDAFEWEAFITQRRELQSLDKQIHSAYLNTLHQPRKVRRPTNYQQVSCAA